MYHKLILSPWHFPLVLFMVAVMVMMFTAARAEKTGSGSLVVFTAPWCANCREVVPIVQGISQVKNLSFQAIDVDGSDAPKQAKQMGLIIPARNLPQVFLVDGSRQSLVFDGRDFVYGQQEEVRAKILNALK